MESRVSATTLKITSTISEIRMFTDISVCDGEKIIDHCKAACLKKSVSFSFLEICDLRNRSHTPDNVAINPFPLKGLMSIIKLHMFTQEDQRK